MSHNGPFRSRAPLTAIESARRAAALKANGDLKQPIDADGSIQMPDEVAVITDPAMPRGNDTFVYGQRAAKILSDCSRAVALASEGTRKAAFQQAAKKIGEAVSGQWLPKSAMIDRLLDIAQAHGSFGLKPEQIQQLIADAAEAIFSPEAVPVSASLKRRLITRRASDVQLEKLIWVWPGRIPEGKLVLVGGTTGPGQKSVNRLHGGDDFKWR